MTTNNSSTGFVSYTGSPTGDSSSGSSSGSSTSPSSGPYLVDIGGPGNSSYSYLTGGMSTGHQLQSIHHQQLQQQQWYNEQALMGGNNQNSLVDGYLSAAAAAHHNLYVPATGLTQQHQPPPPTHQPLHTSHQHQQSTATNSSAINTPAGSDAAPNTVQSARGKNKRKHAGVDKKVYQATMKPIIERQRRARINSSLEELHSLLRLLTGSNLRPRQPNSPTGGDANPGSCSASSGSANSRRIEKADILEQAVRFIKTLSSGAGSFQMNSCGIPSPSSNSNASSNSNGGPSTSGSASSQSQPHREPSPNSQQPNGLQLAAIQQAFCAGYAECTRLTTTWLASHQDCEKSSRSGAQSHDDSHLSANGGDDHDSDSLGDDDDGDGFLGSDDEEQDGGASKQGSGMGQQLRAKLEDHLISRLNERLTAHISKCLPPASAANGRMQPHLIPTPPQSPKDLLLPFLTNGAGVIAPNGVAVASSSNTGAYQQQSLMPQQFSPISPFTQQQMQQQAPQQQQQSQSQIQSNSVNTGGGAQQQQCSTSQQPQTTVIYYDPMTNSTQQQQQQPSTSSQAVMPQVPGSASSNNNNNNNSSNNNNLTPLMADFMDTKDPVALNNAMMFNSFVAQLQQTQRAAAAAGLYCWRPWD